MQGKTPSLLSSLSSFAPLSVQHHCACSFANLPMMSIHVLKCDCEIDNSYSLIYSFKNFVSEFILAWKMDHSNHPAPYD